MSTIKSCQFGLARVKAGTESLTKMHIVFKEYGGNSHVPIQ